MPRTRRAAARRTKRSKVALARRPLRLDEKREGRGAEVTHVAGDGARGTWHKKKKAPGAAAPGLELGESEEIVGKALVGRRDEVVLATKFHGTMGDDVNQRGNSRRRGICKEVENSLTRLKTDWIDLYQVHRPEPDTDIEETLGALSDLVRQGKIRYLGSSTFSPSRVVEAQWAARERNLERFVCEQPPYSLLVRGIEGDLLPTVRRHGMGVIPWNPLAGGWLSGKWRKGNPAPSSTRAQRLPARYDLSIPANQRKLDAVEELALLAEESGTRSCTPAAW